jgi:hypothetical protein
MPQLHTPALPVVLPMLSTSAKPFDDPGCIFELKWDGIRALASVDKSSWRLWGREGIDYTNRYPELEVLRSSARWNDNRRRIGRPTRPPGRFPSAHEPAFFPPAFGIFLYQCHPVRRLRPALLPRTLSLGPATFGTPANAPRRVARIALHQVVRGRCRRREGIFP